MNSSQDGIDLYCSPLRRLTQRFQVSRENWKSKHSRVKKLLKKEQNQVRAVEKSRGLWRTRAEQSEQRVHELTRELADLKMALQ